MEQQQHQSELDAKPTQTKKKPSFLKYVTLTVTSGVIGSALTFAGIFYTDFPAFSQSQTSDSAIVSKSNSTLPVQQITSANSMADIIEAASPAVVGVVNMKQSANRYTRSVENIESGTGSGVIFKKDGQEAYIVTNHHVIEGASEIKVSLYNGETVGAELVGSDALTDLAVLKISAEHVGSVLEFGDSSTLRAGDPVIAIGNPLGLDLSRTVTQGIVSGVERSIEVNTSAGVWELDVIQTDAAINPGNSGGALINTEGKVIGINSLKISESGVEGLGFAIPSNEVLPIINEIIETGKVTRPYIGIGLAGLGEIPPFYLPKLSANVKEGVMVTNVDPNSPAAKANLQVEDIIVALDGKKVADPSDLRKQLYNNYSIGDKIELEVYREGVQQTIMIKL